MRSPTAVPTVHHVVIGPKRLDGVLVTSSAAIGVVIFAHGSGSSRRSPRNAGVAQTLNRRGFATLLFDLLTEQEAQDRGNVFDICPLGSRMGDAISWAISARDLAGLPIGLFGASTGAAAALVAAGIMPDRIAAVVSRGGRPDLAGQLLPRVRSPTLLIVGGADFGVVELNERAFAELTCEKRLEIVPGATHLFEEPGALQTVVTMAGAWFEQHFRSIKR